MQCALRELREETGFQASEWAQAGIFHNAAAYSTECMHCSSTSARTKSSSQS